MSVASAKSPKTTARKRLSPDARRAQLLDTAMSVFAEMGLERAGHGDIAKRAGVSTPTVFNYFPTRDALVRAVLAQIERLIDGLFSQVPPDAETAEDRMLAMAAGYTQLVRDHPDVAKTFLKWEVSFDPDIRPLYLDFQERNLDRLEAYVPDGPDRRTEARILYGSANMLAAMGFDGTDPAAIQSYIRRLSTMLGHES
jgi:TetR/AcrR family hemagglutinin/protease transcriptional regulator